VAALGGSLVYELLYRAIQVAIKAERILCIWKKNSDSDEFTVLSQISNHFIEVLR